MSELGSQSFQTFWNFSWIEEELFNLKSLPIAFSFGRRIWGDPSRWVGLKTWITRIRENSELEVPIVSFLAASNFRSSFFDLIWASIRIVWKFADRLIDWAVRLGCESAKLLISLKRPRITLKSIDQMFLIQPKEVSGSPWAMRFSGRFLVFC